MRKSTWRILTAKDVQYVVSFYWNSNTGFFSIFGAYLAVFYTPSFKVATFAKATSIALFFIGIIMLFVTVGWWGFAGIVGYWLFFTLSRVHWHKRFAERSRSGLG